MKFNITKSDGFSLVQITLNKDEKVRINRDDVVYTTAEIIYQDKIDDYYQNVCGKNDKQTVALAPRSIGRIMKLNIDPINYYFKGDTFLVCDETINTKMANLDGKVNVKHASGRGDLVISAFGDIRELVLDGTAPVFIGYEYLLCFEDALSYEIHKNGLLELKGKGVAFIQTRSEPAFNQFILNR